MEHIEKTIGSNHLDQLSRMQLEAEALDMYGQILVMRSVDKCKAAHLGILPPYYMRQYTIYKNML